MRQKNVKLRLLGGSRIERPRRDTVCHSLLQECQLIDPLILLGLKQRQLSEESTRTESHPDDESSEVATPLDNLSDATTLIPSQDLDQTNVTNSNHILPSSFGLFEAQDEVWQDLGNTFHQTDPLLLPSTSEPDDTTSTGQWHCNETKFSGELEVGTLNNCISTSDMQDCSFPMPPNSHSATTLTQSDQTGVAENHGEREGRAILPSTPFLFINHIRLRDMTFLAATLAIAASIGITSEDYLNDRCSPFYLLSNATSVQTAAHYFGQIVKPHLHPSLTQLSQPHASYLDLIIFPDSESVRSLSLPTILVCWTRSSYLTICCQVV